MRGANVRFAPLATIFAQGDRCDGMMYLASGRVRLSVKSAEGRTVELSVLEAGALFGEGALAGQRLRKSTAQAITACTIVTVAAAEMRRRLHHEVALSDWVRSRLLARNTHIEQDIVNRIFNGSEKRLARSLLLLAEFDRHQLPRYPLPIVSRKILAEMSGVSRGAVDSLMNSFRKRGFLERNTQPNGGIQIHRSLMSVLLQG